MTTGHGEGAGGGRARSGERYGHAGSGHEPGRDAGHEPGHDTGYDPYRAAIDALADPLNDPLPGQRSAPAPGQGAAPTAAMQDPLPGQEPVTARGPAAASYGPGSAPASYHGADAAGVDHEAPSWWFGADPQEPRHEAGKPEPQPTPQAYGNQPGHGRPVYEAPAYGAEAYAAQQSHEADPTYRQQAQGPQQYAAPVTEPEPAPAQAPVREAAAPQTARTVPGPGEEGPSTLKLRSPRRREAAAAVAAVVRTERPPGPSRLEARRAARALKPGPGIIASRAIGEVFITCGVLMLLFVAYQLWWTNFRADQQAGGATDKLHAQWDKHKPGKGIDPERRPGAFKPGEGFAVIHLPKIGITAPIAQGVSKTQVLDKGMVGHYDKAPLKTAMPWDAKGNFALAGHRNTHGEPFRYINRLQTGDVVVVETQSKYYTYRVTRQLPSTSPSDTGVIDPVPPKSGFTEPGRYVTLTTCTPEFTSKYRLIVWGKMVDERPRSKGKPDALVD